MGDGSPGSAGPDPRLDPTACEGLGRGAEDYERARPGYPVEIVDRLAGELGLSPGSRVCDLAAGTGKLTTLLVDRGWEVVAVEPVGRMRAVLETKLRGAVQVRDGTAEALPLPDGSLDAVFVAQAFHWFRYDEALAEIGRVLRSGGGLAVVFNRRDERVRWVLEMSRVIDWEKRTASRYQVVDWAKVLADGGFAPVGHTSVAWNQTVTRDLLAARIRSISYVATSPPEVQEDYVSRVLALTDGFDEPFDLPYETLAWWGRRPAA